MQSLSYGQLRKPRAATLDEVTADHTSILVTRDKGKPAAVLMSLEDFASYERTRHLLRQAASAVRLLEAVASLDAEEGSEHELTGWS